MTVIENINIAYVLQDLSLLSSADADGTRDLRDVACFQTKAIFINTTRKKTRCKIDQQDPRLLDRNLRVRIRWRKIVANQLEIELLSSS